jgi:hypothetical protein
MNEQFKVGDYVRAKFPYGAKHFGENKETLYRTIYGNVLEQEGKLFVLGSGYKLALENAAEVKLAKKKIRENRWIREKLLESNFELTKNLPFSLSLAMKFNNRFCKDFNLVKCRIVVEKIRGKHLIGYHSWAKKIIRIKEDLVDMKKWETFFHEMAHYRQHGHGQSFHEEMGLVYKRFEMWLSEKNLDVAADKNNQEEL